MCNHYHEFGWLMIVMTTIVVGKLDHIDFSSDRIDTKMIKLNGAQHANAEMK